MLVITFPCEGLKDPADRSASKIVDGFVSLKVKRLADECVSRDVGLFVPADVGTWHAQSCVSEEAEDGEQNEENTTLQHNRLEDWMSVKFEPRILNALSFFLKPKGDLMRFSSEIEGNIMIDFVFYIRKQQLSAAFTVNAIR